MEQKLYNALCKFMELQTKDCIWYYDTPEQRFRWAPESIWLINPKTKKWVLQLEKSGTLWWYWDLYVNFQRYFNMEETDFEKFIKIWMEDVLSRGVSTTNRHANIHSGSMEDVLSRGVSTTEIGAWCHSYGVEDVLNRGVSTTVSTMHEQKFGMEDVLNRGVYTTQSVMNGGFHRMEDVLNRGKTIQ